MQAKNILFVGFILLALAVMIGAFGAHGLKTILEPKYMNTFQTGNTYHFYHSFGLVLIGLLKLQWKELKLNKTFYSLSVGIILFSGNCYLYAITQIKTFALIVPVGGILFICGWIFAAHTVIKENK